MTRRYKCNGCEAKKSELLKSLKGGEKVKLKYTFMDWDPESLPLMAYGCGDEFPALLTWKAGLDMKLVDMMMRAEFAKGIRPETFSNNVLEHDAKHYTHSYLHYVQLIAIDRHEEQSMGTTIREREMFSAIDDKDKWNDNIPTGRYFVHVYKQYSATLRSHFSNEVKKRGAERLATDISYKSAKHLCKV